MASSTERTIARQFEFWERAPYPARQVAPGGRHVLVGCGTSYNLALSLAAAWCANGIDATAVPGHEWLLRPHAYVADGLDVRMVAISRSGESSETVAASERSRAAGIEVLAITCEPGSSIVRAADTTIVAETDPEEGIVMTTSATQMLLAGLRLGGIDVDVAAVAGEGRRLLQQLDEAGGPLLAGRKHVVFLGGGALYGIAAEGGLKLQEMSQVVTQAYHPLEFRHGPISLVDGRTLVVMLYAPDTTADESRVAADIRGLGASLIGLGGEGDLALALSGNIETRALAVLPALQLLGERMAQLKSLDTTTPRHLTKVVRIAS